MKIGIVGYGMVGSAVAFGFRTLGHDVIVYDKDSKKNEQARKECYEVANDLKDLVKKSEVIFICVPTPSMEDGSCDTSIVEDVVKKILKTPVEEEKIIVIKSTVIPGTFDKLFPLTNGTKFKLVSNPEFLREAYAKKDFLYPWLGYIVIGGYDRDAVERVADLYKGIDAKLIKTKPKVAEMVKYASNLFHSTKISFANEIGMICERLGIDAKEVMDIIKIEAYGGYYVDPTKGPYGGSCLPKDMAAMLALCRKMGFKPHLLEAVDKVNEEMKKRWKK